MSNLVKHVIQLGLRSAACLLASFVAAPGALAIVTSTIDDTHRVRPGQLSYEMNLDGVGLFGLPKPGSDEIANVLPVCTGAWISNRHVLSAAHCFDEDEDGHVDAVFSVLPLAFVTETPTEIIFSAVDPSRVFLPNTWPEQPHDLAVVELMTTKPDAVPRYRLSAARDEVGSDVVLAGYGQPGYGTTGAADDDHPPAKRAGRNRVDILRADVPGTVWLAIDFDSGQPEHNAFAINGFSSDLGHGADEVFPGPGDSGGPWFIDGHIVGVTAFNARLPAADIDAEPNDSWGEASFATRVADFESFILNATGGEALFVPEPDACWLIIFALIALRRRR